MDVRVARAEVIFLGTNGQAARAIYSSGKNKAGHTRLDLQITKLGFSVMFLDIEEPKIEGWIFPATT